jgi:hypothetical protein
VSVQQSSPPWNPLRCSGTDLPTNLTVLVKVLALVLLIVNHVRILPDPWLPFIPGIDAIPPLLFQRTIQVVFVVSALAILFNRRIRLFSVLLGATMLLAVVSSKAYYGNNKAFCGLMLLLAGLYKRGTPNFLQWQLAITYFGAGLNKLLDPDWHSGVFFENWAVNRLQQPWFIAANSVLPPFVAAKLMCWVTIATELGIVPLLFIRKYFHWAVILNLLFQSSLLLFTGTTFTLFFYSMAAASFAFVTWPASPVSAVYRRGHSFARLAGIIKSLDVDKRFVWTAADDTNGWLNVSAGDQVYSGFGALRMIVLLNPLTYFVIAAAIAAAGDVSGWAVLYRRLIVTACLVLLMPPLAWLADTLTGVKEVKGYPRLLKRT